MSASEGADLDLDRSCEHEEFAAFVDVARLSDDDGGPINGYSANIRIDCARCGERFRFVGVPAGLSFSKPTCSVDEGELHVPIRPASSDPDFGMGIPGFALRFTEGGDP